jgi:predicted enzyme related to lactoylglutathione lyase
MNFNSIMIGTEDVDRLRDFYAKLFGEPGFDEGGYSGWKIGDGFLTIGPHSEVHGKNGEPGRVIWNIESPDVAGDFARLKAAGAIVIRDPYEMEEAPGYPIATLADVDGNYFQLVAPMGSAEA